MFPQGWDKTYCLQVSCARNGSTLQALSGTQFLLADGFKEIHFFGDKTSPVPMAATAARVCHSPAG